MNARWAVFSLTCVISLGFSLSTLGTHPYWQDSGFFLVAVKEFSLLYPPGFGLYELLCKAWTLLLIGANFTCAVHLFSAVSAALASGFIALSTSALLRTQGPLFRCAQEEGPRADWIGLAVGCLAASGYTFWAASILAKVYALYYLVLALLLLSMIRADRSGKPRDFTWVAILIGLAWQAHPSATNAGLALVLFIGFHRRALGWKGIARRAMLSAACALIPFNLMLLLARKESLYNFGEASTPQGYLSYLLGSRFTNEPGAFGFDALRVAGIARFGWEEFLGIGIALVGVGLWRLWTENRRLLAGLAAWGLPMFGVTAAFKLEGQHDFWMVAAWIPLWMVAGLGLWQVCRWAGTRAGLAAVAAGLTWAVLVNARDESQRDYRIAEMYGQVILDPVDRDALLLVEGDHARGLVGYLQSVRGERPDVLSVNPNLLGPLSRDHWYDRSLKRQAAFLKTVDYEEWLNRFPGVPSWQVTAAAFLNGQAGGSRPLFCERFIPPNLLRPDFKLVPAGAVWKLVPRSESSVQDPKYWTFPLEAEQVVGRFRRSRGQVVHRRPGGLDVEPEAYENHYLMLIVMARFHLAMAMTESGNPLQAARLCESVLSLTPRVARIPEIVHLYGISLYAAGDLAKAQPALERSSEISVEPRSRATACYYLGEIARKRGDQREAERRFREAVEIPGLDPATRREIESRLKTGR